MNNKILLKEPSFRDCIKLHIHKIVFCLVYLIIVGSILENTNRDVKFYNINFIPSVT